ncbi:hypothetical protein P3X83_43210, partial [Spongiactinospora sp. TRM90649]|nr:hypothetical protein [Spongiactinospora sp. TRM90649]
LRPVSERQVRAAGSGSEDSLFEIDWVESALPETTAEEIPDLAAAEAIVAEGRPAPEVVTWTITSDPAADPEEAVGAALSVVQAWLADDRFAESRLVLVSRGAVSVGGEPVADLGSAGVWGLVRSAQGEHPGRFVLVDGEAVAGVAELGEPQVAVRDGRVFVPRLVRSAGALALPGQEPGWRLGVAGDGGSLTDV